MWIAMVGASFAGAVVAPAVNAQPIVFCASRGTICDTQLTSDPLGIFSANPECRRIPGE